MPDLLLTFAQSFSQEFMVSRWIFLRLLGVIYGIAFLSLLIQVRGLIGEHGILPAGEYLSAIKSRFRNQAYRLLPTVFWFDARDRTLRLVCWLGIGAAGCLALGFLELPALVLLFVCYLSLTVAGQEFLSFQWDTLLLEAGFLAIFLAPWQVWTGGQAAADVSPVIIWLYWWLLFRLMFESGAVKLSCGDTTWRRLTALDYHYETQPLANRVAWYLHHIPRRLQQFSVAIVLLIEILLPFGIFLPMPFRLIAALGIVLLMLLIFVSGNYNFFNLLTMAFCVLLIDDSLWIKVLPDAILPTLMPSAPVTMTSPIVWLWIVHLILGLCILLVSVPQILQAIWPELDTPLWIERLQRRVRPFHLVNSYGLFRNMTTARPEIVIEGSMDGVLWETYEFRYKPGELKQAPRFMAPHQPRLDWQMWFAALGSYRTTPWFQSFMVRLMEPSQDVLRLMKRVPFQGPPRYLRAQLYDYKFTTAAERKAKGEWWRRELLGRYSPSLMRREPGASDGNVP